nr:hypothetical protein [Bacteroidales bacterium]
MKKILYALLAICFVMASCGTEPVKKEGFKIKRGTNLSHWLSQSTERGEKRRLHIQEDDFARL